MPLARWGDERQTLTGGYLPPLIVTQRLHIHGQCGTQFRARGEDVRRWEIGGRVLWVTTCVGCKSQMTLHSREAGR